MKVRTRFAPSPTGEIHLGNARTAVLNWLLARRHGGEFIVRFEDTDEARNAPGAEARILEALDWLGLDRNEDPVRGGPCAPYRQSEGVEKYREAAAELLRTGAAYPCFCTPEELEGRRRRAHDEGAAPRYDGRCRSLGEDRIEALRAAGRRPAIRLRVEPGPISFRDLVKGEVTIDGADLGDFVLVRSDGMPTYHLAVVVDDIRMRITHVIRAVGHLSNTPKQLLLYGALRARAPYFAHIPTVLAPAGGKLSKRAGATGVLELRDEGYHPDAVVNYLSLLSWSSPSGEEIRSRAELVREADLGRVGHADATLDPEKMRWMSGQHFRREGDEDLAAALRAFAGSDAAALAPVDWTAAAGVLRDRFLTLGEAWRELRGLLAEPDIREEGAGVLAVDEADRVLEAVACAWASLPDWEPGGIREGLRRAGEEVGAGGRRLFVPVRYALTGKGTGPELPGLAHVLGRGRCLARLSGAMGTEGSPDG